MEDEKGVWYVVTPGGYVYISYIPPNNNFLAIKHETEDVSLTDENGAGMLKVRWSDEKQDYEFYYEYPTPSEEALRDQKLKALEERNEFLEECIVEMAGLVYGE